MEYFLNIMGSEWMIIIFVALILLFGTNKLPEAGKKIGKMVGEYNKAKTEPNNPTIDGPVQTERQKLEKMAQTLRIDVVDKSDIELKNAIDAKFGPQESNSENKFKN